MAKIDVHTIAGLKAVYLIDRQAWEAMQRLRRELPDWEFSLDLENCETDKLVYKATLKPKRKVDDGT
jgi:hypothetical protein